MSTADDEIRQKAIDELRCDFLLDEYYRCVNSKRGLSHVDDCPYEADAYKQCTAREHELGISKQRRDERNNMSLWKAIVETVKQKIG